jgi:uncharacterized protein (TIGR02246 family)
MNTRTFLLMGLLAATLFATTLASRAVLVAEDRTDDKSSAPAGDSDGATKPLSDEIREGIEAVIRKGAEGYCQAFCDQDARSASMQFTENAEFVQADGQTLSGREEIESALKTCFAQGHKCRLELSIDSIRFPAPNVAIEDGTSWTIHGDEEIPVEYTAVHVKEGDDWKIASVRERAVPSSRPHREKLRELDWLLGDWIDESSDAAILFSCRPVDDGNFLTRDFVVRVGDEPALTGTQRIGWDPMTRTFRMWYFDSEGGYGEGTLSKRDDEEWILSLSGVTADSEPASATFLYRPVTSNRIVWRVVDQMIGTTHHESDEGEEIILVRQAPTPRAAAAVTTDPHDGKHPKATTSESPAKTEPAKPESPDSPSAPEKPEADEKGRKDD